MGKDKGTKPKMRKRKGSIVVPDKVDWGKHLGKPGADYFNAIYIGETAVVSGLGGCGPCGGRLLGVACCGWRRRH